VAQPPPQRKQQTADGRSVKLPRSAATAHTPPIEIPRVKWDEFTRRFRWKPGEHIILIGPTGRGKSTLAGQVISMRRKYCVALDLKGNDPTLMGWPGGWETTEVWPFAEENERLQGYIRERPDGTKVRVVPPIRLRLAPPVRTDTDIADAAITFDECLQDVFHNGRWCVYVDELLIAIDKDLYDLGDRIHRLMVFSRTRLASVVTATQAPRWIPKAVYQQSTHQFHWPIRDEQEFLRQAEITGLGRTNLRNVFRGMKKHEFLYCKGQDTYMISQAPPPEKLEVVTATKIPVTVDRPPKRESKVRRAAWGRG
jgi:hypothetical protein